MWRIAFILIVFGLMSPPLRGIAYIDGETSANLIPYINRVETLVINEGQGGKVNGMAQALLMLDFSKTKVVINGYCFSSCTLLLSSPNTFITKNAKFYVHSSYNASCIRGEWRYFLGQDTNALMLKLFDQNTATWIVKNRAFYSVDLVMIPNDVIMQDYGSKVIDSDYETLNRSYEPVYKMGKKCH